MGKMDGKIVLISGGAEGLGGMSARHIVAEGGSVMLADVQLEKAEALAEELGDQADAIKLDVREPEEWQAAVAKTVERFGKVTSLVNAAGISEPGMVTDVDLDSWNRVIDINLSGTFHGCRATIPEIAKTGEPGSIVNFGSMIAFRPGAMFAAYAASKAGVRALTRSTALACAQGGLPIRVNLVHPGAIRTPMYERYKFSGMDTPENVETMFAASHPMNRIGEPEEVAKAVLFLLSDDSSFTTGADLTVDGGSSIKE